MMCEREEDVDDEEGAGMGEERSPIEEEADS